MRRISCFSEHTTAYANERTTWRFYVSALVPLPKGSSVRIDMKSEGRAIDWEIPSTNIQQKNQVIWAELDNTILTAQQLDISLFEFILPHDMAVGSSLCMCMGAHGVADDVGGIRAQQTIQRRRAFFIHVDTSKKKHDTEPEIVTIDVKGNTLEQIRIIAPSLVVKNKRFDVHIRFEDQFGNITNNAPEDTLIEVSHGNLRENLKWKLFLPETGFLAVPNLYFNEEGVFFIELTNLLTKKTYSSAPITCVQADTPSIFWGMLHGESERYDAIQEIDSCIRHMRDDISLSFFASSSSESPQETPHDAWKKIVASLDDCYEEERFCTFFGHQWHGEENSEGLREFVFLKESKPIVRTKDSKSSSLKKIYKAATPKEMLSIPLSPMAQGTAYSFDDHSNDYERVVEIYNAWGSSECTAKEGNPFPLWKEYEQGSIQRALLNNCRFGFVAGGLDDREAFSSLYDSDHKQYTPGLTAIICDKLTRHNAFEALYQRHCYATTGARIVVQFSLSGHMMGSELSSESKPGLCINRYIAGHIAGTTALQSIELIRNGQVIATWSTEERFIDIEYDDMEDLSVISLSKDEKHFVFYYLRVTQQDGHKAWSSPIWVDHVPKEIKKTIKAKAKKEK